MKAYRVYRKYDTYIGDVVYAETASKAKYKYIKSADVDDVFSLMRCLSVKRLSYLDNKTPITENQEHLIDKINEKYKIGDTINVIQDDNSIKKWTIKHPASMLGGHTAVIWVEEISGCYSANRVKL